MALNDNVSWLTALALWLFGVGHSAGHVASAYLCTAGLIMSTYLLARRLGGERLGLLSALLLAVAVSWWLISHSDKLEGETE
jgi:4-amino-4-deoxy-L-arabinose transferase-like glycosyltransferase